MINTEYLISDHKNARIQMEDYTGRKYLSYQGGFTMAEYIMLCSFTSKGVEKIKDSPNRITEAKKLFEKNGAKIKALYAVLGQYDTVCIAEAPNDETMAKISLEISSLGSVHAETLRAFTEEQYLKIVNQIS